MDLFTFCVEVREHKSMVTSFRRIARLNGKNSTIKKGIETETQLDSRSTTRNAIELIKQRTFTMYK